MGFLVGWLGNTQGSLNVVISAIAASCHRRSFGTSVHIKFNIIQELGLRFAITWLEPLSLKRQKLISKIEITNLFEIKFNNFPKQGPNVVQGIPTHSASYFRRHILLLFVPCCGPYIYLICALLWATHFYLSIERRPCAAQSNLGVCEAQLQPIPAPAILNLALKSAARSLARITGEIKITWNMELKYMKH